MSLFRPNYTDRKTGTSKESSVWWFEFVYAGKRYRESTKTTRKTLAAECEKRRRLEVERHDSAGIRPDNPTQMLRTVKDAVAHYLAIYDAPNHRPKSIAWVKERAPH